MKGYIFDMDGTIVDNMQYHYQAWKLFLKKHHIFLTDAEFEEKNTGTITEIIQRIFGNSLTPQQLITLGNQKEALFRELYTNNVIAIKGYIHFIKNAHQQGIKIALATMANVHNTALVLDSLQIRQYFTAIITGEMVTHGKPNPEVFFTAIQAMQLQQNEVTIFEDSPSGIAAAMATKAMVVGVCTHFTKAQCLALGVHHAIIDYTNMPNLIRQ
jgi:beta-phosphoglucomutase